MWTVSAPSPSPTRSGRVPTCPLHGVPFGGPGWPEHLSPSVRGPRAGLPSPPGRRERGVQWAAVRGTVLLVRLWPRPAVHPPEAQRPAGLSSGRWPGGSTTPTAEGRRLTGRRLKPNVPSCGSRPGQGASRRTRTGTPARRARGSLSCSPDSAPAHSQTALPGSRPRPWGPLGLSPQKREFSFLILEALDGPLPTQGPSSPALPGPRGACPPDLWL